MEIFGNRSRGEVRMSSLETAVCWRNWPGYEGPGSTVSGTTAPGDGTRVESTEWLAPGRPPVSLVTIRGGLRCRTRCSTCHDQPRAGWGGGDLAVFSASAHDPALTNLRG